jgi:hypothetical protein
VTVTGTVKPNYPLDPPITGAPVLLVRKKNQGTTLASTTVASDGSFSLTFTPTVNDNYLVYVPEYGDGLVLPTNTAFRQSTTATAGVLKVKAVVTLGLTGTTGFDVSVSGTAAPTTGRVAASVQIQAKESGTWVNVGSALPMANGQSTFSTTVTLPGAGRWPLRAQYTDPGVTLPGSSPQVPVVLH